MLLETSAVFVAAVLAVRAASSSEDSRVGWLFPPLVLTALALVPLAIRGRNIMNCIGLSKGRIVPSLIVLGWTCIAIFPLVLGGFWVVKSVETVLPMPAASVPQGDWVGWLCYQFMYVALAEEVFFRGYVQSNILRFVDALIARRPRMGEWATIALSAGCFALAHALVQGQIGSLMTFWPGLVLGWLFIRTRSLLAPILFHGLANVFYVVMCGFFM